MIIYFQTSSCFYSSASCQLKNINTYTLDPLASSVFTCHLQTVRLTLRGKEEINVSQTIFRPCWFVSSDRTAVTRSVSFEVSGVCLRQVLTLSRCSFCKATQTVIKCFLQATALSQTSSEGFAKVPEEKKKRVDSDRKCQFSFASCYLKHFIVIIKKQAP